jgi:hypothetical protein
VHVIAHITINFILLKDGQLFVETSSKARTLPVSKIIYHGIYDDDLDFITGLAYWGGPSLPNARSMMDCRLKLPCLVRALEHTQFGEQRGFASPLMHYETQSGQVAKWGNWHCGENKERFSEDWSGEFPAIIEPFYEGQAVRVVIIGDSYWQIRLEGQNWLKSIHDARADFMDVDAELLEDTRYLKQVFGLEIIANDYIVGIDGRKHLLEVNHIPNVTRFPELWEAYRDFVVDWVSK